MNIYQKLGLLGLLINSLGKTSFCKDDNAHLLKYFEDLGIPAIDRETLVRQLNETVNIIGDHFEYFDGGEMATNEPLSKYLSSLSAEIAKGVFPSRREVSLAIIRYGNLQGTADNRNGADELIAQARRVLDPYEALDGDEVPDHSDERYKADSALLEYLDSVLTLVDVFSTARFGMLAGIEEFAPLDYNEVNPLDFDVAGIECGGTDACKCGCTADHSLKMLQGIEDYLGGKENTPDFFYFEGVTRANGMVVENISGSEGPVFDAVKNLGKVAYKAAQETWENVLKLFESDEDEQDTNITNDADDNKKAIQSMKDKAAAINDKAKAGITAMASKLDPSGAMSKIVARLEGPGSAGGVIDGLLGLLGTNSELTKSIDTEKKAAETALADLKKSAESVSGDDSNKDGAAAAKALINEKISKAKETVASVKKKAQGHSKVTKGIRRAIRGITPHIFVSKEPASKEEDKK